MLSAFVVGVAVPDAEAQQASVQQINISSGPLRQSLIDISNTFGTNVLSSDELVTGKIGPAVSGSYTAGTALSAVLDGSGLAAYVGPGGSYVITIQAEADEPPALEVKPPSAQSAEPDVDPLVEDKIIVVGTKLAVELQDLEVSAEVFDTQRLDREQITELAELLAKVPNVNTIGGADANFSIRGIGRSGVGFAGQGVTSNVYVDGSPITSLNFNRGPLALWDVEQVEVLRGPQSSVQGRNALAGGVFVKTADPTFEPEGKIRATYAEGNTYQVAGAFGGPLVAGLLAGRVAVDLQGSDGFLTNPALGGIDFNTTESTLIRGKLLLAPDSLPNFSTKLTVDYSESEVFGEDNIRVLAPFGDISDPGFAEFDPTDRESFRDPLANDNEGLRIVSETEYGFSDQLTGRAIFTYEDYSTLRTFGDLNDVARFGEAIENDFEESSFSVETRLEFDFDTLRGLVGAYYYEDENKSDRNQQLVLLDQVAGLPGANVDPADSLLLLGFGESFETENYALFGQVDWEVAPRWTLGLGARYDVEEFAETNRFASVAVDPAGCLIAAPALFLGVPSPNPMDPFALVNLPCQLAAEAFFGSEADPFSSADFEAFLPRASLTYKINENSSVFVSLSRGYRAGGAFVAIRENDQIVGFENFVGEYDPEYLTTFEIGTRNVLLDGRLTFNANAFYSKYDDQQVFVDQFDPTEGRDDIIVNAGESTIYGLELTADYDFSDNAGAFLTIGFLETEFDDFPYAVDSDGDPTNIGDPRFANLAGDAFPNAPNVTFTIGGDWEGDNGFFGNASLSYTGEDESSLPNIGNADLRQALIESSADPDLAFDLEAKGEARSNLTGRFGWRNDNYQVYIFGSNLLDSDKFTSQTFATVGREAGVPVLTDAVFAVQPPRVIGIGLDANF